MFRIVFYCAKASWQVQVEVTKLLSAPAVANVIGDSSSRMERKKEKDTAPENGSVPDQLFMFLGIFTMFGTLKPFVSLFLFKLQISKLLNFPLYPSVIPKVQN